MFQLSRRIPRGFSCLYSKGKVFSFRYSLNLDFDNYFSDFGQASELSAGEVGVVGEEDAEQARLEFDFRDILWRIEKGDVFFWVVNFGGCKVFQWCVAEDFNAF